MKQSNNRGQFDDKWGPTHTHTIKKYCFIYCYWVLYTCVVGILYVNMYICTSTCNKCVGHKMWRDLPPVLRSKPPHHELAVSWKPDQHIDKPFDDPFHPMIKFIMVYHVPIGSVVLFLAFCLGNHCPGAQDRSKNQPVVARLRVRPRIKDLSR